MWKQLTTDDLRTILSEDEIEKLDELSLKTGLSTVVQDGLDMVSDSWRGAFQAKGYEMDIREHYTPPEYRYYILVHARWAIWTRFPNTPAYALDESRKAEYEQALKLLKDPYLGTSKPDYSTDPELSGRTDLGGRVNSIQMPFMPKFPDTLY